MPDSARQDSLCSSTKAAGRKNKQYRSSVSWSWAQGTDTATTCGAWCSLLKGEDLGACSCSQLYFWILRHSNTGHAP